MTFQFILYEEKENIGILTLNRPEKRNALNRAMEEEITECFRDAGRKHTAKAVIIRGAGKDFSSGHDRTEIIDGHASSLRKLFQSSMDMMQAIRQAPQPVIAQVHGIAMAGGCHLVAACDLAVAGEKAAKFGMPGIRLGYNCSTPTVAVSRCVGRKKCMEMLMTGRLYGAREALEMGLINRVAADDRLEAETWGFASEISRNSRKTLALSKQFYYSQAEMTEWQAFSYAKEMMALNALMPDAAEGFKASIEKRAPVFPEDVPEN